MGDEAAVVQAADTHDAVDTFVHEVDLAVAGAQGQLQVRMALQELRQSRGDEAACDAARHVHLQTSGDASRFGLEELDDGVGVGEQPARSFEQCGAIGGHRHLARGAV